MSTKQSNILLQSTEDQITTKQLKDCNHVPVTLEMPEKEQMGPYTVKPGWAIC